MGKIIGCAIGFGLLSFAVVYVLSAFLSIGGGQGSIELVTLLVLWSLPGVIVGSACGVCQALRREEKGGDGA